MLRTCIRTLVRSGASAALTLAALISIPPGPGAGRALAADGVVINEIHYDPDVKTDPLEFVELHNPTAETLDLSGWRVGGGVAYTIPAGTRLNPGGYLVVSANPAALQARFGATALGPWAGRLANENESVNLRDSSGAVVDEVDYQLGFPWPTIGIPPGYSIELIHPSLDNSLGGHWRASVTGGGVATVSDLVPAGATWRFRKGTGPASDPATAWRMPGFDDSSWVRGAAPVGYDPSVPMGTTLADMNGNYSSVFLRTDFQVENPAAISELILEARYDDGIKVWLNGVNVLNRNMSSGEVAHDGFSLATREDAAWETHVLAAGAARLLPGRNVLAVQLHNTLLSGSSDCFIDVRLRAGTGPATRGPTPGRQNSVWATNAPPAIRQVEHVPEQPQSGEPVRITARVTDPDGVGPVTLLYQWVDPGAYLELSDAEYATRWTELAMNDAGRDGDEAAGDGVYTVALPASLQVHRRLVRYRLRAVDRGDRAVTVPYPDDPQPNFAYFVYDGVPAWSGAVRPGSVDAVLGATRTFGTDVMRRIPSYHLISKNSSVEQSTWRERYGGDLYKWKGTLVADGRVYDHIGYRARGGVWRYAMGKNMWKFDFNRGHDFQARDNYGRRSPVGWTKLNLGACIQQGDYGHRGEQGMFESVGFALFNLAGVESPRTHFVQFRVVDDAKEADAANQYSGDFWGLYLAVEQEDGRFLDGHGLPDGNLYKMEGGASASAASLNNQGAAAATDRSDLNAFVGAYTGSTPLPDPWWRTNLDLQRYYSYRAIVEGIHHYDIDEGAGKNYFFYLNPESALWSTHAWDLDLTWADSMYGGGNEPFRNRVLASSRAAFRIEYANRVRELRDLLFNEDQAFQLIEEYAGVLRDQGGAGPSFLDADRAMWDYNPLMTNSSLVNLNKAGHGRFYQAATTKTFEGMLTKMKGYVTSRGTGVLDRIAADPLVPARPRLSYTGPAGFPVNRLVFQCSPYSGSAAFHSMRWRVGEVAPANAAAFDPARPRPYEITPVWESGERTGFSDAIAVPPGALRAGRTYRVRVQVRDTTGRTSQWSAPVEFTASEPDTAGDLQAGLRISELMYAPAAGAEYEFVELANVSSRRLDLSGVALTEGVQFEFGEGTTVDPGGVLVLVRAPAVDDFRDFRAHYGLGPATRLAGPFSGRLDDSGERLTIQAPGGGALLSFRYDNGNGWPVMAGNENRSLHLVSNDLPAADPAAWTAAAPTPGIRGPITGDIDSDGDGLPDAWEVLHGLDPSNASDAALDADGDGMSNRDEFRSGTDPRNGSDHLAIREVRWSGAGWVLQFTAAPGRTYRGEFRDGWTGPWRTFATASPVAATTAVEMVHPSDPAVPARFYRIVTP